MSALTLTVAEPAAADRGATAIPARLDARVDSVSCGAANRGSLSDARELAVAGTGYVIPEPWRSRGHRFGSEELVGILQRSAARVAREHPGAVLAIADLSAERGGPIRGHRSHQSGRDADLVFYALASDEVPFPPDHRMAEYRADGRAIHTETPERVDIAERWFDLARNWALVRALLEDREASVARIFVSLGVRRWLLAYATVAGEPEALIARAALALTSPEDAGGHNDHMHLRVACGADDVELGRCTESLARRKRRTRWGRVIACPDPPSPAAIASRH